MPRCNGEGLVVALDTIELATPLYGLVSGSIDAAGGLIEVEGGFTHRITGFRPSFSICLHTLVSMQALSKYACFHSLGIG